MGREDHGCRQQLGGGGGGGGLRLLAKLGGALIKTPETKNHIITHKTILHSEWRGGRGEGGHITCSHIGTTAACILTRAHVGSKNYVQRELKPPQPPCLHPDP